MNIIFYAWALDGLGGDSVHICELSKKLSELGHNITVIVSSNATNYECGINLKRINYIKVRMLSMASFELRAFLAGLIIAIRQRRPDIIYMRHNLLFNCGYFLSKILRIPVITEVNGLIVDESRISGSKNTSLIDKIERFNLRRVNKIIAVTSRLKQVLMSGYNIPGDKIIVIQNGVNTDLFRPINREDTKCGLAGDYNYMGFSGSFAPWHGIEDLVKSAPLILKEVKNTKFILVGNGPMKEQIIQMVNDLNLTDNFIFINRVPYEEVPRYINIFDVCVILKKKDIPGSPLKLWEYMACGKPVIATNTQDFKALEEYNAGMLVDPEKTEEVADAIITLLKNKELREEMGKNGRNYVVENRSWERVAREVEKVMKDAVKEE